MIERPAPSTSTLIAFALVVALMWVPFGVDICGSDQSCLAWVEGFPFDLVITAVIAFTQYGALFALAGTIVPAKWLAVATFVLTLTLTGRSPWTPSLVRACGRLLCTRRTGRQRVAGSQTDTGHRPRARSGCDRRLLAHRAWRRRTADHRSAHRGRSAGRLGTQDEAMASTSCIADRPLDSGDLGQLCQDEALALRRRRSQPRSPDLAR
jgi:hypothetical protein